MNLRIAFKAVIVGNDGKVLILREADTYEEGANVGRWGVPGGRLEPEEPWQDGLRREVSEETGLKIEIVKPLYIGE
jgi:ADP-ribose pyrophosphatase YjhB (NUDIX family)